MFRMENLVQKLRTGLNTKDLFLLQARRLYLYSKADKMGVLGGHRGKWDCRSPGVRSYEGTIREQPTCCSHHGRREEVLGRCERNVWRMAVA
jgi:hypothetical protein